MKGTQLIKWGLIGGGALLLMGVAKKVTALKRLNVKGAKVKSFRFTGLKIEMGIELQVENPGSVDIPIDYFTGSIEHGGTKISDFTFNAQGKNVILKARSLTPITFNLSFSVVSLVTKLIQLIKDISNDRAVDSILQFNAFLYAAGFDIPVNFQYDLKTQQTISGFSRWKKRSATPGSPVVKQPGFSRLKKYSSTPWVHSSNFNPFNNSFIKMRKRPPMNLKIQGIGKTKATLEFDSNREMEEYFGCRKPNIRFSKN